MKATISDHHHQKKENLGDKNGRVSFNDLPKMSFQNKQGGCFFFKNNIIPKPPIQDPSLSFIGRIKETVSFNDLPKMSFQNKQGGC